MSSSIRIAPSILSADFGRLAEEVAAVAAAGADWIHVDVMDGQFVPNLTLGPAVVAAVRRATSLPLDVHLMIERPEAMLESFRDAGADVLTVHLEACRHLQRTLARIRELGLRAGVALNPHSSPLLLEHVLGDVDLVLVMTVNPGFGGQSFLPAMTAKVRQLRAMLERRERRAPGPGEGDPADRGGAGSLPESVQPPEKEVDIEVDGGINPATVVQAAAAGATVFVAGSAVFSQPDYGEIIRALRSGAQAGLVHGA